MSQKDSIKKKLENWWWYHKLHCFYGLVVLALAGYMVWSSSQVTDPDYEVALISTDPYTDEAQASIGAALEAYGEDCNGDGEVVVFLNVYRVDLVNNYSDGGTQDFMEITRMDADLVSNISGMYLLQDPAAFQDQTGILTYRDGTVPEEFSMDVENMVLPWNQIPGLSQVKTGELFVGLRANAENGDAYLQMWNRMVEAAEITAEN